MNRWLGAVVALLAIAPACGQSWPAKPLRFIVPNSVGTSPDIFSRLIADRLTQTLGQQVVVENIANGLVAAERGAKAAPDGYTIFLGSIVALATNLYNFKSIPYDPARDFAPVAMLVDDAPYGIGVNASLPVKSFRELIDHARANPGKLTLASDFGLAGIASRWMIKASGTDIVYVPYKEVSQQLQDVVSGRADFTILSIVSMGPFVKSGKLRVLATTGIKPFPGLDVPVARETVPGFQVGGWFALTVPSGTPAAVIERLNRENNQFVKLPETQQRLHATGFVAAGEASPKETAEFVRTERERWGRIFKDVGIEPQ
jgi:tripartite-type tricarboxylate transporter receptor subunit TctC